MRKINPKNLDPKHTQDPKINPKALNPQSMKP